MSEIQRSYTIIAEDDTLKNLISDYLEYSHYDKPIKKLFESSSDYDNRVDEFKKSDGVLGRYHKMKEQIKLLYPEFRTDHHWIGAINIKNGLKMFEIKTVINVQPAKVIEEEVVC